MAAAAATATTLLRRYSQQHACPVPKHYRLKGLAMSGYLVAAFALPFIPPYMASKQSEQDGTFMTRWANFRSVDVVLRVFVDMHDVEHR